MKKQYIIPATDVIEIKVTQMLTTSLTVLNPSDPTNDLDEGEILSREGEFDEDDFDRIAFILDRFFLFRLFNWLFFFYCGFLFPCAGDCHIAVSNRNPVLRPAKE